MQICMYCTSIKAVSICTILRSSNLWLYIQVSWILYKVLIETLTCKISGHSWNDIYSFVCIEDNSDSKFFTGNYNAFSETLPLKTSLIASIEKRPLSIQSFLKHSQTGESK